LQIDRERYRSSAFARRPLDKTFRLILPFDFLARALTMTSIRKMSEHEIEGEQDKARGKIREGVGKLTGDKGEEMHGKIEQGVGELKKKVGETEEKI
jgi:uncharacterized protein YjbJ (UPF0337 family)